MKVGDHILGPVIALGGAAVMIAASQQPKPVFGSSMGGGFFPSLLGAGLILSGLVLGLGGWRRRNVAPMFRPGAWVGSPRHVANVATVIGGLILYIATSRTLGFMPAGTLVLFLTLWQFTRRPALSLLVSVISILVIKVMFQDMLRVPLPWGVLEPWAGPLTWR